jgi:tetratricopeptide (TPR) repeat protein
MSGNKDRALTEIDSTFTLARKYNSRTALAVTHWLLAWIYLDQSLIEKSIFHYTKCYQLRVEQNPQYLTNFQADHNFYSGIVYLVQAKIDSARTQLMALENLLPDVTYASRERLNYRYDLLQANIAIAEDALDDAEQALQTMRRPARPFRFTYNLLSQNFPFMQDDLAKAYQARGELDKAIAAYEALSTFNPKKKDWRLINPRYHYRLGLLYEKTGQPQKAALAFQRFLNICKLGDPQNPELSDARRRLALLKDD